MALNAFCIEPRIRASFMTRAMRSCRSLTSCSPSAWISAGVREALVNPAMVCAYQAWPPGRAPRPSLARVAGRYWVAMKPRSAR